VRSAPVRTAILLLAASACGGSVPRAGSGSARAGPDAAAAHFVDSVMAQLTLEEKIGQLAMAPANGQTGPHMPEGGEAQVRAGLIGSFIGVVGAAKTHALQRIAVEESPHHIPLLFSLDVIHGFRTVFPVPIAEAASFDPDGAERAGRLAAAEASANGITWTFAPMADIARDPRWGRMVEGSGEDPYLGSVMAAARVRGFQGARISDSGSLMATVKHFAGYGAPEGGRDYGPAEIPEREFWDVYLPPYRAAIDAGARSVMPAFSAVNGSPPHASTWLLRDVLREKLGFEGVVVSDWAGIEELVPHGVAGNPGDAARLALNAGVDVDMADAVYANTAAASARANPLVLARIDESVRRVLLAKYALGLFADPYHGASEERAARVTLTAANRAAARASAREAIVLLKNDASTLPLSRAMKSIAVIGALADDPRSAMGAWAVSGLDSNEVTVLAGIRRANPSMHVVYAEGAQPEGDDTSHISQAETAARGADAVVLVLGENAERTGEAESRAMLELPFAQLRLAQRVWRASHGKPVVAVLMNGRALAIPWIADSIPAILEAWSLGTEHGNAVADVLFGAYNPGGKLPVTFPRATGQVPIYYAHANTGRPFDATDKYTWRYNDLPLTPLFPFGFGLSYTTFRYDSLRASSGSIRASDSLHVTVDVSNTGARDGDEVVQLYVRDSVGSVARPVRQLVRFRRVHLRAGERATVAFAIGPGDLAFHDLQMRRVVEPGEFTLFAGGSSEATLAAHFTVTGDTLVLEPAPPRMQ
jgi:beta-glucosidase